MTKSTVPPGVFEFLDATHIRVGEHLQVLRQLVDRIATDGLDHASQERAKEVLDFFANDARQHHLDEEKHVFPALLASPDAEVVHAAKRLTQDHGWLEENWLAIEPSLSAAADGNTWFDVTELNHALDVFEALYQEHIELEETLAYPAARKRLADVNTDGMGREMAARRAAQKAKAHSKRD